MFALRVQVNTSQKGVLIFETNFFNNFSFKTKGNLTKHMKSKAHFKKCSELGINPIPTMPDDETNDYDDDASEKNRGSFNGRENDSRYGSETEENDSEDEIDDESGDDGEFDLNLFLISYFK